MIISHDSLLEPFSDPHHERIKKQKRAEMDHMFKCQKHLYAFQKQGKQGNQ